MIAGAPTDAPSILQACPGLREHPSHEVLWPSLRQTDWGYSEEGNISKCIELLIRN